MESQLRPYPDKTLRVAVAQAQPYAGDIRANVRQSVALIRQAAEQEARVVLLPEKFLSGYEPDLIKSNPEAYAISPHDERLDPIAAACRESGVTAIVGAATWQADRFYISSVCFNEQGERIMDYHKRALFSSEADFFTPGSEAGVLHIDGWKLGLAICYDSGFAEHARSAAVDGCHAYLVSALFSQGNGYHESRIWMPARALDNTMYVLMSNHVGTTGGWAACGASAIWGPYGNLIVEAHESEPGVVVAELNPEILKQMRCKETMLNDFVNRYSCLSPTVA
ncbi:Predicted amidohydrolase [Marinomonas polaris DSM 16579]|uniref:Predicted amidohydrolase n=1 Tax=Marinomonas polaris DSM 16579 TaxID=1122206 RepID=A0A1M5ABJ0_9GAMM|nr:carbon-nitrogen hydrolase family protein [Marinomonas polaris]SHF27670.1 Predicted amidohydrolase [Marinomonas polaris DSM 16579]